MSLKEILHIFTALHYRESLGESIPKTSDKEGGEILHGGSTTLIQNKDTAQHILVFLK